MRTHYQKRSAPFPQRRFAYTLIELLLVIAIIAVLAAIVTVAINPSKQLSKTLDVRRQANAGMLQIAFNQYFLSRETYPDNDKITAGEANQTPVCRPDALHTDACIDASALVTDNFIDALPTDPSEPCPNFSGFAAYKESNRIKVIATHLGGQGTSMAPGDCPTVIAWSGNNVRISDGTATLNHDLTAAGTLTVDAGSTLVLNGHGTTISGTVANNGTVDLGTTAPNNITFTSGFDSTHGTASVAGTTIPTLSYHDLTVNSPVGSLAADTTVAGTLTVNASKGVDLNNKNLTLQGNASLHDSASLQGQGQITLTGTNQTITLTNGAAVHGTDATHQIRLTSAHTWNLNITGTVTLANLDLCNANASSTVYCYPSCTNTGNCQNTNVIFGPPTGNIDPVNRYAWSDNAGWIDFGTTQGGVIVTDSSLSGYAWGENIGWISLSGSNYGVTNDGHGILSGYAWGDNTGWISFNPQNGGVTIGSDGIFSGFAWGDNVGWISFNCLQTNPPSNVCGASNFKVQTSWRPS